MSISHEAQILKEARAHAEAVFVKNGLDPNKLHRGITASSTDGKLELIDSRNKAQHGATSNHTVDWAVRDLQKRSDQQVLESMANRIWLTVKDNPTMIEVALSALHQELWKEGKPIAYDDVLKVAGDLLQNALVKKRAEERSYEVS